MSSFPFSYKAVDRAGVTRTGVAKAATHIDAYRQITASGLTPLTITPLSGGKRRGRRGVRSSDVAHFTYQLAVLISARIPVGEAFRTIAEQEPPGRFRDALTSISGRIESGEQIASAMSEHADIFGDTYLESVRAAEKTVNLIKVLEYLSDMLERSIETRQLLRASLTYPLCVVVVLVVAVLFLLGFVIPKFAKIFSERGLSLPGFTQALVYLGVSMQQFWWAYLLGTGLIVYGLRRFWQTPDGRATFEDFFHRVPYLRDILVGLGVSRFARVFGLCLSSGIGLIDALEMSGKASGRLRLKADADKMVEHVRRGGRVAESLASCAYLPAFAKRMISAGEESAELPRMCTIVARHYDRETTVLTKNICTVIEPVLIVAVAGVVLVVALAVFLPMWDMVKLVG